MQRLQSLILLVFSIFNGLTVWLSNVYKTRSFKPLVVGYLVEGVFQCLLLSRTEPTSPTRTAVYLVQLFCQSLCGTPRGCICRQVWDPLVSLETLSHLDEHLDLARGSVQGVCSCCSAVSSESAHLLRVCARIVVWLYRHDRTSRLNPCSPGCANDNKG